MKKMSEKDIKTVLECAEKIEKIALIYKIEGSLAQIFIEAYRQEKELTKEVNQEIREERGREVDAEYDSKQVGRITIRRTK